MAARAADLAPFAVLVVDVPRGTLAHANDLAAALLGESSEDLRGRDLRVLSPDAGILRSLLDEASPEPREREIRLRLAGGRMLRVSVSVRGVPGQRAALLGLRDVTEGRQEELRRRTRDEHYRSLFADVRDAVYVTTRDGRIVDCNPSFLELFGVSEDDVPELDVRDLYVDPSDRERFQEAVEGHGWVQEMDVRLRRKDGSVLECILTSSVRRGPDGEVVGYHGIVHDVTARRCVERALEETEERLRTVVANAPVVVFALDAQGVFTLSAGRGLEPLGLEEGEAVGRNALEMYAEQPDIVAGLRRVLGGEPVHTAARVGARHFEWTAAPIVDEHGRVSGATGVAVDVTEVATLQERLREAARMESIGRLAGGVAHDFNNLLTAVTGHCELLLEEMGGEDPGRVHALEIRRGAELAASLTRQLLAFSRRQILRPQILDLNQVVVRMSALLRRLIGEDVELILDLDPHAVWVRADPGQMEQVVMNLAVNARDAMPRGGCLTVGTHAGPPRGPRKAAANEASGDRITLTVTDTGEGMSEDVRTRIFEPFFTTKEMGRGTGLGLATVYGIVNQSEGTIDVDSEPGRGSTFRIHLPRSAPPSAESGEGDDARPLRGAGTILVVEDEVAVRGLVSRVLEGLGYEVTAVGDPREALELASSGSFDLLLTDVVLPAFSGPELARRLVEEGRTFKLAFMSGYAPDGSVRDAILASGAPLLEKPFTPDALAATVRGVLEAT